LKNTLAETQRTRSQEEERRAMRALLHARIL
jgi:hypothetical protein